MRSPFGLLLLACVGHAQTQADDAPSPAVPSDPVDAAATPGSPVNFINAPLFAPTIGPNPVITDVQGGAQNTTEEPVTAPADNTTTPVVNTTTTEVAAPANTTDTTGDPVPAPVAAPFSAPECYSNLTELSYVVDNANPFIQSTYIICPHTVYEIGYPGTDGACCTGPNEPLQLRSNSHYLCKFQILGCCFCMTVSVYLISAWSFCSICQTGGEDGKVENNCTLWSGQFQVLASKAAFDREDVVNVKLQGITFADGANSGVLLVTAGDIEFIDCIFRVSQFQR